MPLPSPFAEGPHAGEALAAVDAVRQAARLCIDWAVGDSFLKEDSSPVTLADFAAQALIARQLRRAYPDDPIVAEEDSSSLKGPASGAALITVTQAVARYLPEATAESVCTWIDLGRGPASRRFWALDPIDGTKGFLRGDPYVLALALIEAGKVVLGVLGCPRLDAPGASQDGRPGSLWVAVRGQGAWAAPLEGGEFARLRVSSCAKPAEARVLRSYEAAHTDVERLDALLDHLGVQAPAERMDSQVKYALLAAGHGELIFRLLSPYRPGYSERIWDHAAGALLVEEAGGRVTDLHGAGLDFGSGRTLIHNTGVLASNGLLHAAALRAIRAAGADRRRVLGDP